MKNDKSFYSSQGVFYLLMFVVAIVYIFFQGNNLFSEDSIAYANNVKYGENLFWPHHLLYSAFNYCLFVPSKQIIHSLDALRFMQFMNGVFGLLCLFVFHKIMTQLTCDREKTNVWTFFVASCFGVMRFSVEVEAYIIPIFFSLLSSLSFLKFLKTEQRRYVILCSLSASVACLFHQIHLFWGIGLFIGFVLNGKLKDVLLYSFPTLSVLIIYSLVMFLYDGIEFSCSNLWSYLSHYYYSENAEVGLGVSNLVLTPISFIRTFFQVHGIILDVLRLIPLFWVIIPIVFFLLGLSLYHLKGIHIKKTRFIEHRYEFIHLIIFVSQFLFAFFSHGNAEFMVMLPFLIPLFIYSVLDFNLKGVYYFSTAMLIWNFCFSIYPNHRFDYFNNRQLLQAIERNTEAAFILMQRNIIVEQHYYETGKYEEDRLIHFERDKDILRLQSENRIFHTDLLSRKMPFNRARFINDSDYKSLHLVRHIEQIDTDLGCFNIDQVEVHKRQKQMDSVTITD